MNHKICICLPTIIEIQIYEYGPPFPPESLSFLQKSQILNLWYDFDENWNTTFSYVYHFWMVDCFSPGMFCNVHIFAYYLVEFLCIQKKHRWGNFLRNYDGVPPLPVVFFYLNFSLFRTKKNVIHFYFVYIFQAPWTSIVEALHRSTSKYSFTMCVYYMYYTHILLLCVLVMILLKRNFNTHVNRIFYIDMFWMN